MGQLEIEIAKHDKRKQILLAAIRKAYENGYSFNGYLLPTLERSIDTLYIDRHYYAILFDLNFAKAFWGDKTVCSSCGKDPEKGGAKWTCGSCGAEDWYDTTAWSYNIQYMSLENDPLDYISKFVKEEADGKS